MLIKANNSCLLVVDIQEKLVPAVHENQQLIQASKWLIEVANIIGVPVLTSEQYPKGLGGTVAEIDQLVSDEGKMDKLHFSCGSDSDCLKKILSTARDQVVIVGMEAHVCVLQTAMELNSKGKDVFIVADAVSSRNPSDKQLALERMRQNGLQIVSREMVAFEWMEKSGTDIFRKISTEYLR
ncbi:hydrolase [Motiliproteus sp. MSK22-1]|uniref:hydrolase n=1 Tax=Motiliproteus sp. MSK22-1 TaxID=1897630 RepID=UPI0009766F14|nr:hydrolase [Motiliproteus sp. MSK22-1]OMH32851.1 hydrolase [Motiliproteus sp. MSK22-1]